MTEVNDELLSERWTKEQPPCFAFGRDTRQASANFDGPDGDNQLQCAAHDALHVSMDRLESADSFPVWHHATLGTS